jgi:hypothetical protein
VRGWVDARCAREGAIVTGASKMSDLLMALAAAYPLPPAPGTNRICSSHPRQALSPGSCQCAVCLLLYVLTTRLLHVASPRLLHV